MKKFFKELVPYIIVIIVVLIIKRYVVTPIKVNGSSMNATLFDGDLMILDEVSYKANSIQRFDIVVLRYNGEYLIKRVIGMPNETISYKNNKLYIDGEFVEEDFDHAITYNFAEVKLGEDEYFVMGDNRTNSLDSRVIGPVNIKLIRGTTSFIFYPFSRFGNVE